MNGPKHKALLKRLRVTAYPTILYLRDGAMREYDGSQRTTAALAAFGRSGYKDTPPVPWYRAPNGLAGKLTGAFFRLPVLAGARLIVYISHETWHDGETSPTPNLSSCAAAPC